MITTHIGYPPEMKIEFFSGSATEHEKIELTPVTLGILRVDSLASVSTWIVFAFRSNSSMPSKDEEDPP
jgi:hypothetical protein